MNKLQKIGGIAALYEAAAYIIGFTLYFGVLDSSSLDGIAAKLTYLAETKSLQQSANAIIYVGFGVALVVLITALHERLISKSEAMARIASAFGLIWAGLVISSGMIANIGIDMVLDVRATDPAQAATIWQSLAAVQGGLGGGVEIVGGLWLLLLSVAALDGNALPKLLNYLGIVVGSAGIITVIPPISEMGAAIFGLGQILWFLWIGIALLQHKTETDVEAPVT